MYASTKTLLSMYDEPVGSDPLYSAAHGHQHVAQVLDMWFARGIVYRGDTVGETGGHDAVLARRDGGLV